jgi:uncharacterized membrane protein
LAQVGTNTVALLLYAAWTLSAVVGLIQSRRRPAIALAAAIFTVPFLFLGVGLGGTPQADETGPGSLLAPIIMATAFLVFWVSLAPAHPLSRRLGAFRSPR